MTPTTPARYIALERELAALRRGRGPLDPPRHQISRLRDESTTARELAYRARTRADAARTRWDHLIATATDRGDRLGA
jgi:hypothetical protein